VGKRGDVGEYVLVVSASGRTAGVGVVADLAWRAKRRYIDVKGNEETRKRATNDGRADDDDFPPPQHVFCVVFRSPVSTVFPYGAGLWVVGVRFVGTTTETRTTDEDDGFPFFFTGSRVLAEVDRFADAPVLPSSFYQSIFV
jgi:hypothetical protein